jgi:DNA repair protein RadC
MRTTITCGRFSGVLLLKDLLVQERPGMKSKPLTVAKDVSEFLQTLPWDWTRESVYALHFTAQHRVQHVDLVSVGSLMSTVIHPREVFRSAVQRNAAAIVLAHNHPSGDPTPSVEDHQVTIRIAEAGALLGIRVLDHLVITQDGKFKSFKEEGWLPERW